MPCSAVASNSKADDANFPHRSTPSGTHRPSPKESTLSLRHAARAQIDVTLSYDRLHRLAYPGGDVPPERGVCTDVVIRALRAVDIDLQRLVHEDMRAHFGADTALWGLTRTDRNIDHRRVPNPETRLRRHGMALPVSNGASGPAPGDIVT